MRKVDPANDNVIDRNIITFCEYVNPSLYKRGITPNMVTAVGLLTGALSLYTLYNRNIVAFVILNLFTYYTDCQDGSLARAYDQCTREGDLFDHIRDGLLITGTLCIVLVMYKPPGDEILAILLVFMLCLMQFGCQQKHYLANAKPPPSCTEAETLNVLTCLCPEDTLPLNIFGFGTFVMITTVWIITLYMRQNP